MRSPKQSEMTDLRDLGFCALSPHHSPSHAVDIFFDRDVTPTCAMVLPRPAHSVTRTQSGSFISPLSKRPTPELSTPGPMDDRDENITYEHEGRGDVAMQDNRRPSYSLATPAISPVIPTIDMPEDTQDPVHKVRTYSAASASTRELTAGKQMTELEHSLAARVLDVRALEDQLLELQTECSTAVQNLSHSDARIKALQAEILTVENQASELQAKNNDLQASVTSHVEERDRTIKERNASIVALEAEREKYLMQLAGFQNSLSQAEAAITSHVAQASTAKDEAEALRSAVEAAEASNTTLVNKQKITDAELQEYLTNISKLEEQVSELQAYKVRTVETVAQMSTQNASISKKLQSAEARNEYLSSQLSTVANEKTTLELAWATSKYDLAQRSAALETLSESLVQAQEETAALLNELNIMKLSVLRLEKDLGISRKTAEELNLQLATSGEERAELTIQLIDAKQIIVDMSSSLKETNYKLSSVESAAERFQAEAKANEVDAQQLRLQLTAVQSEALTTAEQLFASQAGHARESTEQKSISDLQQRLESTQTELQLQLQKQGDQLVETKRTLEAEQKRSSDLEERLEATVNKTQEAEEELSDMREFKKADERTIESLKEMFTTLRETQMRSLAELDNKVSWLASLRPISLNPICFSHRLCLRILHPHPKGDRPGLGTLAKYLRSTRRNLDNKRCLPTMLHVILLHKLIQANWIRLILP